MKIEKKKSLILIAIFVFVALVVIGACTATHLTNKNEPKIDENNIGEVYYAQIDPDHVSETDIGTLYADNELLIVASEKAEYDDIEKIVSEYKGEIVGWIEQTGDFQIKFPNTYTVSELNQISDKISKNKLIISSNPNYIVEYVNDDFYGFEFGKEWEQDLQAFDYLGKSWGWEVIRTFDAWWYMDKIKANGATINPIRVGLIDCGFDESHEDLDFAEVSYNKTAIDREHGTHVAGTMAARADNNVGICGVYPYGKNNLYGVADGGSPNYGGVSKYAENGTFWSSAMGQKIAFSELILRDVKVINQSMGFNLYQSDFFKNKSGSIDYKALKKFWNDSSNFNDDIENAKILGDFLHRLIERGHEFVIISAAGNDSDKSIGHLEAKYSSWNNMIRYEDYPDVYNRIIVVGAVDKRYNMSSFSNAGSRVDVFAPGETIFSTVPNDKYDNKNGTSMAAPHVSGVAALIWTVNNDLTGAEVKSIICDDSNRSNVVKTCKMIDAYNCVVAASNTKKNTKLYDKKNGGVLNFVVDKDDESIRIEGAKVTALKESKVISTAQTDQYGHFELILPAGIYDIIIEKEPYETYRWNNITVEAGEVNYLSDWTKLELEKIVVELPDTKDIFYCYIKSDLIPVYGLSELRVNQINSAEKPNYDGVNGIISAYINEVDSQAYLITIRFDNQAEKPHLIFEMYQYINNEVVKIDTFDNELDEYTLGFNAGLSNNYLCFYDYRHFNYASSSYGLHYYILKVTKSGFEKSFNLCHSHAAGGVNWIYNLFMDDKSYFETSDGSGDGLSEAVEAIKDDLENIGFNNYEIKCDTDPESFVFNIKYDENIMSCSLYEQDITDYTDLRSHLNSNDEIDFDIIKEGRYENDIIKVDVKGVLNEEGKIRIEYNLDNSHVSVANYEGTLKETLEFKASDWFGENSYSIVFDNESLHIVIQENPAWDQAAAISLPKADAELKYTTFDIPNYDISSWSDEMIIQAINQYLKSTEKWNKYAAFDIDLNDKRAFLRYQGGSEANTLTNLIVIWGIHEDYAQLAQYQSDSFGEIFHLTEYIDEPSSNKYYTEPLIEVYTASPWANGLTYILHMEGDFSSYSYILYTNESSNELVYTSSGSSDQTTIELCSSSTVSKVKVLITPYNKDNKPEQTIQIEADDSNLISISPINSVDKRGIINANGGVVAGYNIVDVSWTPKDNFGQQWTEIPDKSVLFVVENTKFPK